MQSNYSRRMEGREVNLGGINFLIYPFGAFTAANLSGELTGMLLPAAGALAPLLEGDKKLSLDDDVLEAAPQIAQAFSMVSGDKIERLLKKLLCSKNIVLRDKGEYLTEEMADEIFCAEIQDMYLLAFYVLKENFGGFFEKISALFGNLGKEEGGLGIQTSTATLTQAGSGN